MKIKISEQQAIRLGLINEQTINPVDQFTELCKKLVIEVNKTYQQVINISVEDVIKNSVNIEEIDKKLDQIETLISDGSRKAYHYLEANAGDDDLFSKIDQAYDSVNGKLTPLQLIVMDLGKLQHLAINHKLAKSFSDIKPLDITDIQNS